MFITGKDTNFPQRKRCMEWDRGEIPPKHGASNCLSYVVMDSMVMDSMTSSKPLCVTVSVEYCQLGNLSKSLVSRVCIGVLPYTDYMADFWFPALLGGWN